MAREHPRLERFAPDMVGTPTAGLVHARRPGSRRRERRRSARDRAADVRDARPNARSRHARYLVLERTLALLDSRMAGTDDRTGVLVSVSGHGHRWRDHLSLGRAHGDAGAALHGRRSVPRRRPDATGLRRSGPQDVQVARQHHRPDGLGRNIRCRRVSHLDSPPDAPREPGDPLPRVTRRRGAQLQQQDLERYPVYSLHCPRGCRRL